MADISQAFRPKSAAEQRIEAAHGATVEALLRRLYVAEGMTQQQVADTLGVGREAVVNWMAKYRIPTRDRRAVPAEARVA